MTLQSSLKYWRTRDKFPHGCFVIRRFSLPNLSEYSAPLQFFNSDYGTDLQGGQLVLFKRGKPGHFSSRKVIWKGSREDFKIAIQGGGEFYELGLYGLQGPITEREWNERLSNAIADLLLKGGELAPPCWTLRQDSLSGIADRDLFGPIVPV